MEVGGVIFLEFDWGCLLVLIDVIAFKFFQKVFDFFLIFVGENGFVFFLLLFVSFDLDSLLGDEGLKRDFLGNFDDMLGISDERKVEHAGVDVGTSLDELDMDGIVQIQFNSRGGSLQATPEEFAGVLNDMIKGEG